MKNYKLDYKKIKTIADLKKILAMANLTFSDNGNPDSLKDIVYMLKEVELDLTVDEVDYEEVSRD